MSRPMRPILPVGRPPPSFVHFSPPSSLLIDAALRAALDDLPRLAVLVVHRRVERRRRLAVDHEIDRADAVVDVEHFLPRLAAVDRAEHAALVVPREEMSHRRDVDDVRIRRVDDDARDVMRVGQAHELPGLAGVGGLEDALAGDTTIARSPGRPCRSRRCSDSTARSRRRRRRGADAVGHGAHVVPALVVFQRPPLRDAA